MKKHGGQIFAVSVDPPERSRKVVEKYQIPFPILADVDRKVIKEYGLVHAHGGPDDSDIAIPANILIDKSGRVIWRYISRTAYDRADPAITLEKIRAMK